MTRFKKIVYLITKGEEILYHNRESDGRLFIDAIKNDNGWEEFKMTTKDQKRAGELIDLLYFEWTMIV